MIICKDIQEDLILRYSTPYFNLHGYMVFSIGNEVGILTNMLVEEMIYYIDNVNPLQTYDICITV